MDKEKEIQLVSDIQAAVAQMVIDDIEEQPETEFETFQCACCGCEKTMAGSIMYTENLLCNDCVLIAETALALNKIKNVEELVKSMEDKRLENLCHFITEEESQDSEN